MAEYLWKGEDAEVKLARMMLTCKATANRNSKPQYDNAMGILSHRFQSPEAQRLCRAERVAEEEELNFYEISKKIDVELMPTTSPLLKDGASAYPLALTDNLYSMLIKLPHGAAVKEHVHTHGTEIDVILHDGVYSNGLFCHHSFISITKPKSRISRYYMAPETNNVPKWIWSTILPDDRSYEIEKMIDYSSCWNPDSFFIIEQAEATA